MTSTQPIVKPGSAMPYVWAMVILVLIAALFVVAILYLRPQSDPLVVISTVGATAALIFTQIATLMKTQETHATVNDASTEKVKLAEDAAHARGLIEGAEKEQARIAKQALMAAATGPAAPPEVALDAAPLPVKVVAAVPVPVTETPGDKK